MNLTVAKLGHGTKELRRQRPIRQRLPSKPLSFPYAVLMMCFLAPEVNATNIVRPGAQRALRGIAAPGLLNRWKSTTWTSTKAKPRRIRSLPGFYYGLGEDVIKQNLEHQSLNDSLDIRTIDQGIDQGTDQHSNRLLPSEETIVSPQHFSALDDQANGLARLAEEEAWDDDNLTADTNALFRETIKELRRTANTIQLEMQLLRKELREYYNKGDFPYSDRTTRLDETIEYGSDADPAAMQVRRKKRRKFFDTIAISVEQWAEQLVEEGGREEHGWKHIPCNSFLKRKYDAKSTTKCFLKWMRDPRGEKFAMKDDDGEYPCIKCFGVLDAPLDKVCAFLADEQGIREYNDLVENYRDLEDISPYSKICWGQCPQVLFVKPRDFVTFCSHRWKSDGTQVVINQAVDHDDAPLAVDKEGDGRVCRARALRGANFISPDPSDPKNKTILTLIAHADPGGGLPNWATKTAVNALAPIEPFKLYFNLNKAVQSYPYNPPSNSNDDQGALANTDFVSSTTSPRRSAKPGGLSQLGYACFWPNGGGLVDNR